MLIENCIFYQFFEHILIIIIVLSLFYLFKNKKLINIQKNKYFKKYIIFVGGMSLKFILYMLILKTILYQLSLLIY